METLHYICAIIACIAGFLAHYLSTREKEMYTQLSNLNDRVDRIERTDHEQFKECVLLIREVSNKLDEIKTQLSEHAVANSAIKADVDNVKEKVDRLEAWFGTVLEKK